MQERDGGPRVHRGRWLACFAVLLCVSSLTPLLATPTAEGAEEPTSSAPAPPPSPAELAALEDKEREHAEWLEGTEAAQQRESSRTAYTDLTSGEAQGLLVEAFPEQLQALNEDPGRVLSELEIEKPLGTFGARIATEGGGSAIVESSVPVESDLGGEGSEPVDLTLEPSGNGFAPENPLTEVQLPGSAEEPIQLQGGVSIELPTGDDHPAQPLGDKNLFYPETETATDTLASPIARGVEVFEQLRSPESPQDFRFDFSLPAGASLRTDGGGAEVVSFSGNMLGEVPPPSAVDAQGSVVPVSMSVEGDSLLLQVDHRSSEVAYPVLLDPATTKGSSRRPS